MATSIRRSILIGSTALVLVGALYSESMADNKPITGIRFMTERFTVASSPDNPLKRVPPQPGFVTTMPSKAAVKILDGRGRWVGSLTPITQENIVNKEGAVTTCDPNVDACPVCLIAQSYPSPRGMRPLNPDSGLKARIEVPAPGLESFICQVSYHVEIFGMEQDLVVSGPRIVRVGKTRLDPKDNRLTTPVEIVEMYLSGFDAKGNLITVRGGRNFGLPLIPGEMKALTSKSYFPASLQFDLELEVTNWGIAATDEVDKPAN